MSNPDPETWVHEHGDYLYRFALARLRRPDFAEEVVQDAFLSAWEKRDSFDGKASIRTWLTAILRNKIVDHIRRRSREEKHRDVSIDFDALAAQFDDTGHPVVRPDRWPKDASARAQAQEFWDGFYACLNHLPERTANAFTMKEIEQMPSEAICKELAITPTNYWVILHRARLHMRKCLEEHWVAGVR